MKTLTISERLSLLREKLKGTEKELEAEKARSKQPSLRMELDHRCKQLQEEIGLVESEQRAEKRAELLARMPSLVEELRSKPLTQLQQWKALEKLCLLVEATEKLFGARKRWRRIDHVKCLILDPIWRQRKLPRVSTFGRSPAGPIIETGSKVDPVHEGDEMHEWISWKMAHRLEKEGKVKIIDDGMPIYDEEVISDLEPEILNIMKALDFGPPIPDPITGELLPEFAQAAKEYGPGFRLSFEAAERLIQEERRQALWKKLSK